MNIKGKYVTLRAIRKDDSQLLVDMFNDPEIENSVVGWAFPLSIDHQYHWYDNSIGDTKNQRFIIENDNSEAVGLATLTSIDWKNRQAAHGIKLASKPIYKKGIGTDAVMAIERYAFEELGLHRLNGSWLANNRASEHLYKKCGWRIEGVKKACIYKHGKWIDLVIAGILDSDYKELVEINDYWEDLHTQKMD